MFLVLKIFLFGQRIELIFSDTRNIRHWPFSLQKKTNKKRQDIGIWFMSWLPFSEKMPFH